MLRTREHVGVVLFALAVVLLIAGVAFAVGYILGKALI
jgi:hypothetical protein